MWLLSEQEVTRAAYEFDTGTGSSTTRYKKSTNYAHCQGVCIHAAGGSYDGNSCWWLRSPKYDSNISEIIVYTDGKLLQQGASVYDTGGGVVPAVKITL